MNREFVVRKVASDNHLDDLSTSCKQLDRPLSPSRSCSPFTSPSSSIPSSLPETSIPCSESKSSPRSVQVDGGWAWVIIFASFWCNFIVDGINFSFSVLQEEIRQHFGSSVGATAWVNSLQTGCYLLVGECLTFVLHHHTLVSPLFGVN